MLASVTISPTATAARASSINSPFAITGKRLGLWLAISIVFFMGVVRTGLAVEGSQARSLFYHIGYSFEIPNRLKADYLWEGGWLLEHWPRFPYPCHRPFVEIGVIAAALAAVAPAQRTRRAGNLADEPRGFRSQRRGRLSRSLHGAHVT